MMKPKLLRSTLVPFAMQSTWQGMRPLQHRKLPPTAPANVPATAPVMAVDVATVQAPMAPAMALAMATPTVPDLLEAGARAGVLHLLRLTTRAAIQSPLRQLPECAGPWHSHHLRDVLAENLKRQDERCQ
mmetsp:Transcript_140084/g.261169  ORF Transcript_140084/g.261169 Transcript_140084/m.261169 type:complete len:130 (-) Transcript_140084:28-417(-)